MTNAINLLLINQIHNYILTIFNAKIQFLKKIQFSIFQHLAAHAFWYVFKKIANQYNMLIDQSTIFFVL